jgi:hypothetical protein
MKTHNLTLFGIKEIRWCIHLLAGHQRLKTLAVVLVATNRKYIWKKLAGFCTLIIISLVLAAWIADAELTKAGPNAKEIQQDACSRTSLDALNSCRTSAQSAYSLSLGNCDNIPDPGARKQCQQEALVTLHQALQTCQDQFVARQQLCGLLGGGPYNPVIDPGKFGGPIDNPYFPLIPGRTLIYEAHTVDGIKRNTVTTTHDTVQILGVTCVQVHDVVYLDGERIEDTLDWFAQDHEGNVWYFGENTLEISNGLIVSTEGTFTSGVNGAKPGIIMEAHPAIGDAYRQEFVLGTGEDSEQVVGLDKTVHVPYGTFDHCLEIKETTALEPTVIVHDFYAPGIGPVMSLESGERLELVQIVNE